MWLGQLSVLVIVTIGVLLRHQVCYGLTNEVTTWGGIWQIEPTTSTPNSAWSLHTRIPMTAPSKTNPDEESYYDYDELARKKGGFKVKKKYRKFLLPLLIAYKLKFFAMIPVMIGGLLLLTGATGLAGFFFALFAATMGLNKTH